MEKIFYTKKQAELFLKEQIIKGDDGDGVPNILSDDDSLAAEGKRQKSMFAKNVEVWKHKDPLQFCESAKVLKNYWRNQKLIDLSQTPLELQDAIMAKAFMPSNGNQQTVTEYFMVHRMRNLLGVINEF